MRSEGQEERSDDRSLHSTITNNLLLIASLIAIPHPNPFRASLIEETSFATFPNVT